MSEGFNRNNNPNQKPITAMNEYLLHLTGDKIGDNKRPPSLMLNVKRDGKQGPWCAALAVRTNVENDKDYGRIEFLISLSDMFMILEMVNRWADATEAGSDRMEISNRRYLRSQNAWSKEPMLVGSVSVGRTQSGQVFIGVQSYEPDRPKCRFIVKPTVDYRRSVKLFKRDGTEWEEGPLSQLYAKGWARQMGLLIADAYKNDHIPAPPKEQQQGGGNYGNNRGGGGSNYGSNRGNDSGGTDNGGWSDDDIPM